jgi:hypothetical protein
MEESILNHSVAISRIEDCEDDMQICKGDIDALKINHSSIEWDIWMLEGSMGSVTISPFWPCFWPSSFFFSHQVHALLKSLCKKTTKTSYK